MPHVWIDTGIDLSPASSAQLTVSLMTGVSDTQTRFDRMTLLRTIIGIDVAYSVHDSGEGSQQASFGIGITDQEAFAAGTVPDPQTDTDFPQRGWIWWARYRIFGFAADQPAVFTRWIDLDLRSQRKLNNGEAFLTVFNGPVEGTTGVINPIGLVRQLWLVG